MGLIEQPDPLSKVIDLAKYLSEPAWNLEGCALVGQQMYELAVAAQGQHRGAVEALRWIAEYGTRDGDLRLGHKEAMRAIAQNWLTAHGEEQ